MLDLLRKIFGIHSPSRWGMSKKEWRQLHKKIIREVDRGIKEQEHIFHHYGLNLENGKDL